VFKNMHIKILKWQKQLSDILFSGWPRLLAPLFDQRRWGQGGAEARLPPSNWAGQRAGLGRVSKFINKIIMIGIKRKTGEI
jgi:hypothetical protein